MERSAAWPIAGFILAMVLAVGGWRYVWAFWALCSLFIHTALRHGQ